jgi:hypothetical protein
MGGFKRAERSRIVLPLRFTGLLEATVYGETRHRGHP